MSMWKRKVKHDLYTMRVSIPAVLVKRMGWESCRYVTIEDVGDNLLIIRRWDGNEVDTKMEA